jgi:hypothetical protein
MELKGEKDEREKVISFVKSFISGSDKDLAADPLYKDFKKKTKAEWGKPGEDYYVAEHCMEFKSIWDEKGNLHNFETDNDALFAYDKGAKKLGICFCRDEGEEDAYCFFEPLFNAFPAIEFIYEDLQAKFNNSDEQLGSGYVARIVWKGKRISWKCEEVSPDEGEWDEDDSDEDEPSKPLAKPLAKPVPAPKKKPPRKS